MWWNFDNEKMSRVAVFIADWSRDKDTTRRRRVSSYHSPAVRGRETTSTTRRRILTLTDGYCAIDDTLFSLSCFGCHCQ